MKDTATRQREWRAKRMAEGQQMVTVWLDPDTAKVLAEMVIKQDKPKQTARQEIINEAIGHYARSLDDKV
jgi:ABC-type Zn2+ transport system substrate-binding protein/surface adhesin